MKTCWSDDNPRRRFYACSRDKFGGGCGWKDWKDPKFCDEYSHVILKLLSRIKQLEEEKARKKKVV